MKFKYLDKLALLMSVVGLLVFIFGMIEQDIQLKHTIFLISALFLFFPPVMQKEPFFSGLQTVVLISSSMTFLDISQKINLIVFIVSAVVFAAIFFVKNKINLPQVFAFFGLLMLCLGIVIGSNIPMLISGLALAVYAIFSIRDGFSVAWAFLVLNLTVSSTAVYTLLF